MHQKTDKMQPTNKYTAVNAHWLHLAMPPPFGEEHFFRLIIWFLILHLLSLSSLSFNTLRIPPTPFP